MRKLVLSLGILAMVASPTFAAIGDWWILPIDRLDGSFTTIAGAGYAGTDAKQGDNMDGVRRVWWNTNNVYASSGASMPATPELFSVEAWVSSSGPLDWQPIETQINGYAGDAFPIEPNIPWAGQFSTNHQWLGNGPPASPRDYWFATGPGPQAPENTNYNAGGNGTAMWMKAGTVLYSKWDFPWDIHHAHSMIRITQVTPEPASMALLALGGLGLLRRKRHA